MKERKLFDIQYITVINTFIDNMMGVSEPKVEDLIMWKKAIFIVKQIYTSTDPATVAICWHILETEEQFEPALQIIKRSYPEKVSDRCEWLEKES